MEGTVFADKYRVTQIIRAEGPVESYRGADDAGTEVAIKVVHTNNQLITQRFERDLQAVTGIQHPNLASTLGWGPHDDGYYAVREWAPGTDLASMQRQGQMTPMHAAEYAEQACGALSAIHARNVVHKDIRPENLVLEADGTIKLVDVGIPKAGVSVAAPSVGPDAVHYICPEQARGQMPVPQSDIYSLGVTLYFLSTGRVPFDADTAQAVVDQHINAQAEPPRRLNPEIPASLESLIVRAMAKDPSQRYSTAEEMRQDLARITAAPAMAPPPPKHKIWPWVVVGGAVLAIIVAALWWFSATVAVPNLQGMTPTAAQQTLRAAGLRLGETTYQQPAPAGVALGTVMQQTPAAHSRAREMTAVDIVIAGPEQAEVPNLAGMTQDAATSAIQKARLKVGSVQQAFNATVPAGNVSRQNPAAGTTVPIGSPVAMTVSKGVQMGAVPNVVGSSQADAITALQNAGFKVSTSQSYSGSVPQGDVISQNPEAGADVDTGSKVSILVSRGPRSVSVPNVVGMLQVHATNTLEDAGLKVRVTYTTSGTPGKVASQSPQADDNVAPGSTVTITVSQTPPSPPPTGTP